MNWAEMSTARKILLPAALLLLIDLFLSWQKACAGAGGFEVCGSKSGWSGIGIVVGLLTLALLVWEGLQLFARDSVNLNVPEALISAGLAAAILLFTIIKFLSDGEARHWPAWLGLLLALVIGYGGWLRYKESDDVLPARSGMGGTTGTSDMGTTGTSSSMTGTEADPGMAGTGGMAGGTSTTPPPAGTTGTTRPDETPPA